MIHVCWHEGADGFVRATGRSRYSCCTMLNEMFDMYNCEHWSTFANMPKGIDGAVVMVQGGNERGRVEEISTDIAILGWSIIIVIGDEACDFPLTQLFRPPNSLLWVQMPEPQHTVADRYLPVGYTKDVPLHVGKRKQEKTLDWFFAGQNTHHRRQACTTQLAHMKGGVLLRSSGFMQGFSHDEYFGHMARAKVIPCPSGPACPDTFRIWEALEFGCVPIVDVHCPRYTSPDYWRMVLGDVPFPLIEEWAMLPHVMEDTLLQWDYFNHECQQWWKSYKLTFRNWLERDLACLTTT